MSNKSSIKPLSIALGAAFVTSLAASNVASAAEQGVNPFAMNELSSGYVVAKEGKCGEGKNAKTKKEGKCGEAKCGGNMEKHDKEMEGKCGADKKGKKEGKCGEGKCGGNK